MHLPYVTARMIKRLVGACACARVPFADGPFFVPYDVESRCFILEIPAYHNKFFLAMCERED